MNDKARFIRKRRHARDKAMQALYQWQMSDEELNWIRDMYVEEQGITAGDPQYFLELLYEIPQNLGSIDSNWRTCTDRSQDQLDPIETSILRIATWELMSHPEIPWRAVINEAVELVKSYGADDGHKFVNGVLDPLARQLRPLETAARAGKDDGAR